MNIQKRTELYLLEILNKLDKSLYDELDDYDKGRKDIINLLFNREKLPKKEKYILKENYHYGDQTIIPAGTEVEQALNLPQPNEAEIAYWIKPWKGMNKYQKSWMRNYGYGIGKKNIIKIK